jgi:hypothetical protein
MNVHDLAAHRRADRGDFIDQPICIGLDRATPTNHLRVATAVAAELLAIRNVNIE